MYDVDSGLGNETAKKERKRVMIHFFEDASNGEGSCVVVPITDAVLESRIKMLPGTILVKFKNVHNIILNYTRAIGRIMLLLHSFVNGHTASSTAMAPFFIHGAPTRETCYSSVLFLLSDLKAPSYFLSNNLRVFTWR